MSFVAELKRRKVIRVAIAYVIGAWLLLQLAEVLSELLNLPDKIGPIVVAVVAIGFPVVVVLAWMFELTASGLKRDDEVSDNERSSGKFINVAVVGLLLVALSYFVWESRFQTPTESGSTSTTIQQSGPAAHDAASDVPYIGRSVAVLPFESFSTEPGDAAFADGLTDTILHQLAQIEALKVIARNSTFQFKGSNRDVREIGEILDVETVLEGSVQRAGNRVRVIAQLVSTRDGAHVWSESFDESLDNIFELQDNITSDIVNAFQISLSAAEQDRLLRAGTSNPDAYRLVIEAQGVDRDFDELVVIEPENDERLQLLLQAVELDPDYALAWANVSRTWNGLAFATDSPLARERYIEESLRAAETALALDDSLALSHAARGWVSHRQGETLEAARYFRRALDIDPNNLGAMSGLALQLGRSDPEEALQILERTHKLDPTSTIIYRQKHFALLTLGRVDEAMEQLKLAIEAEPDLGLYYADLTFLLSQSGRPDEAARYNSQLLALNPTTQDGHLAMARAWLSAMEAGRAMEWIELTLASRPGAESALITKIAILEAVGDLDGAARVLESIPVTDGNRWFLPLNRSVLCLRLRQAECTRQQLDQLLVALDEAKARGFASPDFDLFPAQVEMLLSEQLDPSSSTVRDSARIVLNILGQDMSGRWGPAFMTNAGAMARLGNVDEAMALLFSSLEVAGGAVFNEDLLGMRAEDSLMLDPLRGHPDFPRWLAAHKERRDAMRERMQTMERNGDIMPVRQADRLIRS